MATGASILIVEPDQPAAVELVELLRGSGYRSRAVATGGEAMKLLSDSQPDLVLLEWSLPDIDATALCRYIRTRSDIPLLVTSASQQEAAAVASLEAGADGFLTKPFSRRELLIWLDAALQRFSPQSLRARGGAYVVGDLTLDIERHEVWLAGRKVELPLREFQLLAVLVASPGKVWSREALMQRVWGESLSSGTKSLAVHVSRIRARIEEEPSSPKRLLTVRGRGYTFAPGAQDPPDESFGPSPDGHAAAGAFLDGRPAASPPR